MSEIKLESIVPPLERHRKAIRIIWWIFILAGSFLLGVLFGALDVEPAARVRTEILWLILVGGGTIAVNLLWGFQMAKAINSLSPLLMEDPDRYMAGIHLLLDGKKGRGTTAIRLINLSAACTRKQDYAAARAYLEQLDPKKLPKPNRHIYWLDMALNLFFLGENEKALAIMEEQRALFDANRAGPTGPLISLLDIFEALARNGKEAALKRLEEVKARGFGAEYQAYLEEVEKILAE